MLPGPVTVLPGLEYLCYSVSVSGNSRDSGNVSASATSAKVVLVPKL